MASDIVLYKATVVPVGEDQLPHLELTREIARRFNSIYGQTFPEPKAKMTNYPSVVGLDGKGKMSKQADNDIEIAMSEKETLKKISTAYTDPARRYRSDPGHPTKCNIYKLLGYFNDPATKKIAAKCKKAKIGCVECKKLLAEAINNSLKPIRQRRAKLVADSAYIKKVLDDGAERARIIAQQTLKEVKHNMNLI
jgi:tryptophanyl-tRNA synthetase